MNELLDFRDFLIGLGLNSKQTEIFQGILVAIIFIIASVALFYITRFIIQKIFKSIISKTKTDYDDILIKEKVFDPVSHIVPAIIFIIGVKYATTNPIIIQLVRDLTFVYLIFAFLIVIFRILNTLNGIYEIYSKKRNLSVQIKQYIQVFKIIFSIAAIIFAFSILFHKKPGAILAGLGAMTAVLLLIFKDSIMSLVASVQISAYKLVKVGDWITIPSKSVDGDIMDISLNTIQIRNFDKTISTIPTYTLIQEPFINWSGMVQSGGRRIKRSIYIDMNSIQLCTPEMIEKFKKIKFVSDYVTKTQEQIDNWNITNKIEPPINVNGRAQTNLGIFRKYIENYLRSNFREFKKYSKQNFIIDNKVVEYFVIDDPEEFKKDFDSNIERHLEIIEEKVVIKNVEKFLIQYPEKYILENMYLYKTEKEIEEVIVKGAKIEFEKFNKITIKEGDFSDDLTLLIRQLKPQDNGLPLEVYVFASSTEWGKYEEIQSNLFDHIFAVLPEFGLRVFQQPSSNDFHSFVTGEQKNTTKDTITNKQ
ncbi:MAG: mechanosensitive ion channel [Bacteroidales bacterium]|nr:mechanosensitive ion channel [Bacteroidales bacterium]